METLLSWIGGESELIQSCWVAVGVAFRVVPIGLLTPWLAYGSTPTFLRTLLSLMLIPILFPYAIETASPLPMDTPRFFSLALREATIGTVFAITASLPFYALQWAGRLTDIWRGAELVKANAPSGTATGNDLGTLYIQMGIVLFFSVGGHRIALSAMVDTLITLPIGKTIESTTVSELVWESARILTTALTFSAIFAAPIAAIIFVWELLMGLVGRSIPYVPIFLIGMPLRASLGVAVGLLTLSLLLSALPASFEDAIKTASHLISRMAQ